MPTLHASLKTQPHGTSHTTLPLSPMMSSPSTPVVAHPGAIHMWADRDDQPHAVTKQVAFGVAEGDVVYLVGFRAGPSERWQVDVFRDGGSLMTSTGVPTQTGDKVLHFFAVFGNDILTPAMRTTRKRFLKLTGPQIRHLFREEPLSVLRRIAPSHAVPAAQQRIRNSLKRRRQ